MSQGARRFSEQREGWWASNLTLYADHFSHEEVASRHKTKWEFSH